MALPCRVILGVLALGLYAFGVNALDAYARVVWSRRVSQVSFTQTKKVFSVYAFDPADGFDPEDAYPTCVNQTTESTEIGPTIAPTTAPTPAPTTAPTTGPVNTPVLRVNITSTSASLAIHQDQVAIIVMAVLLFIMGKSNRLNLLTQ